MSSHSHAYYTSIWVKELTKIFGDKIVLFSVDYRLAEEGCYPKSLSDCWQAYLWLINIGTYYLGINSKIKIIVTGDSAGGNLALALCNLTIKECVRKPDSVFLNYSPLNLDRESFTSSLFFSFTDAMLPFSFIELCLKNYISEKGVNVKIDPFISPGIASVEFLKRYPPITMTCGEIDPLRD